VQLFRGKKSSPMSPIGIILPLVCLLLSVATAKSLVSLFGVPRPLGRFVSIDGLRGYLALAVFISHTAVWYYYVRTGRWEDPPSRLYVHFGQSSVALFFMITGFLFYSKLLDCRGRSIDWTRLYVSRLLRLFPLYLFAIVVMFVILAYLSDGELKVSTPMLLYGCLHWVIFSILGGPDINGVKDTATIIAGVTWSLSYEWFFYASLPVLGLPLFVPVPKRYLVLSIVGIVGFLMLRPFPMRLLAFVGGIAAAVLVRNVALCNLAKKPSATVLAIGCICLTLSRFSTAYAPLPLLLLSVAFVIVACGNTLFGVLTNSCSRMLGDMSYSIYLLHGILLFCVFRFLIGVDRAAALSTMEHCAAVIFCTPILIIASFVTYRMIELPGMRRVPQVEAWLHTHFPWVLVPHN
jgi:peptidoglycan/LPS O-acetylase OafA/YrhL